MIRVMLYLFGAIAIIFSAYGAGNAAGATITATGTPPATGGMHTGHMKHEMPGGPMHGDQMMEDKRIQLNLPPMMAQHQKAHMREHLKAVNEVVHYIGAKDFEAAAKTAHEKLGLTAQMKQMCDNMPNETFRKMGIDFHQSADALAEVLKTKDADRSLKALDAVLTKCTACHDMFRQ